MPFLLRYEKDRSRPRIGQALRDLVVRAVAPGVVLFLAIWGAGVALMGPLKPLGTSEESISQDVAAHRTGTLDTVSAWCSQLGSTGYVIAVCVVMVLLVWWLTREWWYALVPGIAVALQASTFVAATELTGRPRPQVTHLDPAPPTSSYPSGHVGASTALYVSLALLAHRIPHPALRRLVQTLCLLVPLVVAAARLYRGMHHVTDIGVGMLNGLVCATLAWLWVRRTERHAS